MITKEKISGPDIVVTHTPYNWTLRITLTNTGGSPAQGVVVYDVIPAEFGVAEYWASEGTASFVQSGDGELGSTSLTWIIGILSPGREAVLEFTISTILNPAGKQEFTSPGIYSLNDGAWVTWVDPVSGLKLSDGPTPPITVTAYDPIKIEIEIDIPIDDRDYEFYIKGEFTPWLKSYLRRRL